MRIQFDPDTLTAAVDYEAYLSLTQGTPFQQSLVLLTMISNYLEEFQKEAIGHPDLTPEQYKHVLKNLAYESEAFIRLNPPPGIDPEALRVFCD